MKLKFHTAKDTISQVNQKPIEWEKCTSIHTKLKKLNTKIRNNTNEKEGIEFYRYLK